MSDAPRPDRLAQGRQTRSEVLGPEHVARSDAKRSEHDARFIDLITEAAWGHVWSSDAISRRERSMLTIALLAALGNEEELRLHLKAIHNTGASRSDVIEALHHVAIYAGVPRANSAIRIAKEIWAEEDGAA
ncbi:4-carboxymuconolactone decarboxylase [Pseudoroseicyclus tamaricis]|uniref:4-carboxymuconolactone decarboxylase n=1 Tax=Pseudoroseicyclus tamaricis TaxID=2705421 RepID=A0A6B2JSH4_9RHOB|nr:4-carboxymuconolactone decarboxylase [Pseudoroseicyclus tamaricis]NDU99528.1 4-carboxymuconolactone decarboxylase [Pseudoroseicyclus tamaricis]